jgi:hypothetical protein
MRKGAPWLKTTLMNAPGPPTARRPSYFQAQFHRLRARGGAKKAIGALAASILTTVYHMLSNGMLYQELGPGHLNAAPRPRKPGVLLPACKTSATPSKSPQCRHDRRSVSF